MSYEPSDFDLAAAILRRTADPAELIGYLATKLQAALPAQTRIDKGGMFGRGPVQRIEVALGNSLYTIAVQRSGLVGQRAKTVRGVVISHEDLTVDHWVHELTADLQALAKESEMFDEAIRRLALG